MRYPLIVLFVLISSSMTFAHADVLIENVTIVSPDRSKPLRHQYVLIRGERIAAISARPPSTTKGTQRIDARGNYLTPGIMDSHVHLGEAPGLPPGSNDAEHRELRNAFFRQQPRSYLYFGVTQLLDPASHADSAETFEAQPLHPDLFRCGFAPVLDGYPSVFVPRPLRYALMPTYIYEPANSNHPLPSGENAAEHTPEAVVDEIAASGASCVKVFLESGFGGARDWPLLSAESLQRVVAAARKRALLVLAHANSLEMQRMAVDGRVDVIAHGLWNWGAPASASGLPAPVAAVLRRVHELKIGYQPTLRVLPGMADLFRHDTLQDPMYEKVVPAALLAWYSTEEGQWFKQQTRTDYDNAADVKIAHIHLQIAAQGMRAAKYLHDLGHPLLLGSDTPSAPTYGNQPGYDTYREMRFMAQSGIPLDAIFRAATINNAEQFRLQRDYGTIAVGKYANLLLLDANPLETIRAWNLIDKVVLKGRVIEREELVAQ